MNELIETVFTKVPPIYLIIGSTVLALFMGTIALIVRTKAAKRPVTPLKIILPPLFMSTGALMFIFEEFRVPLPQVLEALFVGMLFSIILIKTTNFERKDSDIYMKRSKAFLFILLGLTYCPARRKADSQQYNRCRGIGRYVLDSRIWHDCPLADRHAYSNTKK